MLGLPSLRIRVNGDEVFRETLERCNFHAAKEGQEHRLYQLRTSPGWILTVALRPIERAALAAQSHLPLQDGKHPVVGA